MSYGSGADLPASWMAELETDEQMATRIGNLLAEASAAEELAVSLEKAAGGLFRLTVYFRAAPDEDMARALVAAAGGPQAAAALRFSPLAARDWIGESLAGLKPVEAGRFVVHGAHDRAGIPVNRIGIEIEAALAFGTGHHGTTRGCLLALDRILKSASISGRKLRILDLGTGSGVLAIAVARALRQHVLATDIDANAVRAARANARLNRVGDMLNIIRADGVAARSVRVQAPFDLIVANILLGPLLRLASPLKHLTAPGGRIVLSGLLAAQANAVIAAYRPFALEYRLNLDGWTTLVFVRRRRSRHAVARPDRP